MAKFVPTDLTEIYKDFKITDFIFGKKLTIYGIGLSFDIIVSVAILGLYQIFNAYLMIKKVLQGYFFESQSHIYKVGFINILMIAAFMFMVFFGIFR